MSSVTSNKNLRSPILVTGAHRTGTTWVGKMLAASGEAAYISEPLNIWHRPGVMRVPIQYWYKYICERNENEFLDALHDTIHFRYLLLAEIGSLRSKKDVLRMGRDINIFLYGNLLRKRALLKDPFAVFSAIWFAEKFGCQVVITVRHPAAFASSLKRLNWPFDFKHLLSQPLLMQDWLEPFRSKMETLAERPDDILGQASLLWCIIYRVIMQYRLERPDFQIVRHEDLSLDPVKGYQTLYSNLGLRFIPRVEQAILKSSSSDNPKELSKHSTYSVRLDSQANLINWKKRLEPQEIVRIRNITEETASFYYPDLGWD
jgi:hypothetical protein